MSLRQDITELLSEGVIDERTASDIHRYFASKTGSRKEERLYSVFGIIGSLLVGLGIILIVAHNWDNLGRSIRTFFAFLPLLIGQVAVGYTLARQKESTAWREGSAIFIFLAIGTSISLVSQIYNIPGNISSFVVTWMLLALPLVYLIPSSMVSLLYLVGITYFGTQTDYLGNGRELDLRYWALLIGIIPHYSSLIAERPVGNFAGLHHWLIPISLTIMLGSFAQQHEIVMFPAFVCLFAIFYFIGTSSHFKGRHPLANAYLPIGALGTIGILMAFTFRGMWKEVLSDSINMDGLILAPETMLLTILLVIAVILFVKRNRNRPPAEMRPLEVVFLLFTLLFFIGLTSSLVVIAMNFLVLIIGILTIRYGAIRDHLGILNYGLLVITVLIICRFVDTDLSFVARGIMFVIVGLGFFLTNYLTLKKRKSHGQG